MPGREGERVEGGGSERGVCESKIVFVCERGREEIKKKKKSGITGTKK